MAKVGRLSVTHQWTAPKTYEQQASSAPGGRQWSTPLAFCYLGHEVWYSMIQTPVTSNKLCVCMCKQKMSGVKKNI